MNDLERAFRRAMFRTMDNRGRSGLLGRLDGTVVFTDAAGNVHRNLVWVRVVSAASVTEVVAENTGVSLQPNLPVRIADINGVPTIIGTDTKKANIFTGGYVFDVAEHAFTHGRFGVDPLYITGPQFLPLMAVPTNPVDMTVTVMEGWYRWEYNINVWTEAASSDLSSYVPGSTGQQHFAVLSLDRSTNTLVITDGTTETTLATNAVPFDSTDILPVVRTLNAAYYPIAAIRFYYGQTTIKAPDIFKDLRLWGGEGGFGTYTGITNQDSLTATDSVTVVGAYPVSVQDDATVTESVTVTVA